MARGRPCPAILPRRTHQGRHDPPSHGQVSPGLGSRTTCLGWWCRKDSRDLRPFNARANARVTGHAFLRRTLGRRSIQCYWLPRRWGRGVAAHPTLTGHTMWEAVPSGDLFQDARSAAYLGPSGLRERSASHTYPLTTPIGVSRTVGVTKSRSASITISMSL